jgi:diguanylate cyclase (GGDEF)-like protein/PAS domain S-box-containing protein
MDDGGGRRSRVALALAPLGLVALVYAIVAAVSVGSFAELERTRAREDAARLRRVLSGQLTALERLATDWAVWDDTWAYVVDRDPAWVASNVQATTFANAAVVGLALVDDRGDPVLAVGYDPVRDSLGPPPPALLAAAAPDSPLLRPRRADEAVTGFVAAPGAPLALAARTIVRSDGSGPERGTLIFAAAVDEALLAEVRGASGLTVELRRLDPPAGDPVGHTARLAADFGGRDPVLVLDAHRVASCPTFRDLGGRPLFALCGIGRRAIWKEGLAARRSVLLLLAGLGVLATIAFVCGRAYVSRQRSARRRSEALYRAFIEQTSDGLLLADARAGLVIDVNAAARQLFGLGDRPIAGRPLADLLPDAATGVLAAIADAPPGRPVDLGALDVGQGGDRRRVEVTTSLLSHDTRPVACTVLRDVTERFLAYHDPLTGLPNRRLFADRLARALSRARPHGEPLAVLFVDLDGLKRVNDSLGHPAGDALIAEAGRRLRGAVRADDTVARAGGDEFLILLDPVRQRGDAVAIAERVLAALRLPVEAGGQHVRATGSVGIALSPQDGTNADELTRKADLAMYHAKQRGKDRWHLYDVEATRQLGDVIELRGRLETAIGDDELVLHFQPLVDLRGGRVVGLEALVRWRLATGELVPPSRFIRVAEEAGLIGRLGERVLRSACAQVARWRADGLDPPRVYVNVSANEFTRTALVDVVRAALDEHGVEPGRLGLEITEGAAIDNPEAARAVVAALAATGVSVAIDDFGTGYSSLAWLRDFPVDRVKIDRSFIVDLTPAGPNARFVRSMIELAHAVGRQVVAEGVESLETCALLAEYGCEFAQGYALARPLPAAEAAALLAAGGNLLDRARRARRAAPGPPTSAAGAVAELRRPDRAAGA